MQLKGGKAMAEKLKVTGATDANAPALTIFDVVAGEFQKAYDEECSREGKPMIIEPPTFTHLRTLLSLLEVRLRCGKKRERGDLYWMKWDVMQCGSLRTAVSFLGFFFYIDLFIPSFFPFFSFFFFCIYFVSILEWKYYIMLQ